jgi:hypothetical protein
MPAREVIAVRGRDASVGVWLEGLADGYRVTSLAGPRAIDPRRFGVPSQGSDWYVEGDPASFGLCLAQLERALLAREPGVLLVGDGQGAALVLALACCWAERLSGVIAIDGALPELPADALAERPMKELPVLLAGDHRDSAAWLQERGARVSSVESLDSLAGAISRLFVR